MTGDVKMSLPSKRISSGGREFCAVSLPRYSWRFLRECLELLQFRREVNLQKKVAGGGSIKVARDGEQ